MDKDGEMKVVLGRTWFGTQSYGWQNMGSKHQGFNGEACFMSAQTIEELMKRLRVWIEGVR